MRIRAEPAWMETDSNQHGNRLSMHLSSLLSASFPILAATAGSRRRGCGSRCGAQGEAVEADVELKESSAPAHGWAGSSGAGLGAADISHTDVASSWLSECQTGQGC